VSDRRYAVVGTGGIGGLYGGRLIAAGNDVTFVARSDAQVLRRDGLHVQSVDGDLSLAPGSFGVVTDAADLGPVDVAIVAVKTTADDQLPGLLRPLVGPDTTVIVLQNGLGVEALADAAAPGAAAVLGGMCFVCCMRDAPGLIRHVDFGLVTLGRHRGDPDALDEMAATFDAAAIDVQAVADLHTERWRKLLWNIPFNGLSVVLRTGTDRLLADPDGRLLVERVMAEVVAGANACGAGLTPHDAAGMVERIDGPRPRSPAAVGVRGDPSRAGPRGGGRRHADADRRRAVAAAGGDRPGEPHVSARCGRGTRRGLTDR
jgi:2-dehydropantoate 2-reductase